MIELARALGFQLSTVSRVVNGNRLSIPVGQAIADHLGKPLEELFPAIHEKKLRIDRRKQKPAFVRPVYNTQSLRKACKHLMVDLGLDCRGAYFVILPRLSEAMGETIYLNRLSMALTGYRQSQVSQSLLIVLHDLLKNWPQKAA